MCPMNTRLLACWLTVVFRLGIAELAQAAPPDSIEFNRDIRPILSQNCFACHGFDSKKRQGDLRLDESQSALRSHDGRQAIKPGNLEQSELWQRIMATDADLQMPPPTSHKKLTAAQKELIRRWIEQGARYEKHWAFEPPRKPTLPVVKNSRWARSGIDHFILQRLEREGLQPQGEASREVLIRRVAFALTGLPPTIAEVDRYLADNSSDAYEQMVDRYLSSPAYGEEMARHWLDVARYADTHGLHLDNERQMWPYRDWVVKALNDDLPFDQFTIWQLAGDLLPNPTNEQLTATGFNRCNVTTSEGGSIAEEFLYRYAVDRTSTLIETWLGLTGGCAVCHDHKYDPLSMREFYSLYAFFYSAADPAMDRNAKDTEPFLKLPAPTEQRALQSAIDQERSSLPPLQRAATLAEYVDPSVYGVAVAPRDIRDVLVDDFFPFGSSIRNTSRNASTWDDRPTFGAKSGRRVLRQQSAYFFEDVVQFQLASVVAPYGGQISVWVRLDERDTPDAVSLVVNSSGNRRVWWGAAETEARLVGNMAKSVHRGALPKSGEWTQLTFSLDELQVTPGQRITSIALQQVGGITWWDTLSLSGELSPAIDPLASLSAWWNSVGSKAPAEVPDELQKIVTSPKGDHAPELLQKLRHFYLAQVARPYDDSLDQHRHDWEQARAERMAIEDAIGGTMIFRDLTKPRDAYVMLRGQYDKPGDGVQPGVPAILPALKTQSTSDRATRLDLARWLVEPDHPLTARVTANRFWQQFFGTGLVKTSFDFGTQGDPPSHPELLDYLGHEFVQRGWRIKDFVRLLLQSSTFRQRSNVTDELRQRDSENRLYARGPRFRLDAEPLRDNALAVSGLLERKMGGPGVKSYQPPNIWEPVGYSDSNTRYYLQDHGSALYRRSLYTFLKRTAPPPFMSNFDAPNREQFCTRRERSNTPLQALQLMNDVQHFEAARALAERTLASATKTDERITFLYRTLLARGPTVEERRLIAKAYETQYALFAADPAAATRTIEVGESKPRGVAPVVETAAWTLIANLLLNLDETITRN